MEEKKIVEIFLENNLQISPDALKYIEKTNVDLAEAINKIKEGKEIDRIITSEILEKTLKLTKKSISILKFPKPSEKPLTTETLSKYFLQKYEKLKKILEKKPELSNIISINKIGPKSTDFSLIAMIVERVSEDGFVDVEDQSGRTTVDLSQVDHLVRKKIIPDEIIGLYCEKTENKILVKNIVFPDVPLKKQVGRTSEKHLLVFISNLPQEKTDILAENLMAKAETDKMIVLLSNSKSVEDQFNVLKQKLKNCEIYSISDKTIPFFSSISIDDQVNVCITDGEVIKRYNEFWTDETSQNIILNLLQKRDMNPVFSFSDKIYDEYPFILEEIPDIILDSGFGTGGILNYKGTTIVSNGKNEGKNTYWIINLNSRETIKIELT